MKHSNLGAAVTLWANRAIALLVGALLFVMPALLDWYRTVRQLSDGEGKAILYGFYACAGVILLALWQMDRLLLSIGRGAVFIPENVRRIRNIRLCCLLVGLICVPVALVYYPLLFIVLIMGFLSLVVGVVQQTMAAAVAIREENDLTI